tara:strand:- start:1475 stop:1975 length:501 start_codon:yes stop_codon:yes gene_type:complete
MDWFKFDINGYLADFRVQRLSASDEYFYIRLLLMLYKFDGKIEVKTEQNWQEITQFCKQSNPKMTQKRVKSLSNLLQISDGVITQPKVTKTLQEYGETRVKLSEAGRRGGKATQARLKQRETDKEKEKEQVKACDWPGCQAQATLHYKGGPRRCPEHLPSRVRAQA